MSGELRWRRRTWNRLRVALSLYLVFLILTAVLQRKLIFLASKTDESTLLESAERLRLKPWRNGDGEIIGWRAQHVDFVPSNRLLVFHGNAGYALMRNHFRIGFERVEGGRLWDVVLFEYPGYGARQGNPSEATISSAAAEALEQLIVEDDRPVYLAGESLGSGPACHLAGRFPGKVRGLFLITPFPSLTDVAAYHYPFLPVRLIMLDRFDNVAALSNYHGPLAVLLAGHDRIVPARLGRRLFDSYEGPKIMKTLEEAGHNQIDFAPGAEWWRTLSDFLLATP